MGHRNPDRVPLHVRRNRGETVGKMIAEKWDVISICRTCQLIMQVDLRMIVLAKGPNVSLWNRKARCRRLSFFMAAQEISKSIPGSGRNSRKSSVA